MGCERLDAEFLVAELDRVTADRFRSERDNALARAETAIGELRRIEALSEVAQCLYDGDVAGAVETALEEISAERDATIASRNAWAEKAASMRKALSRAELWLMERHQDHQQEGLAIIQAALAATEPNQ
jgi:hypothetical protein